MPGIYSRFHPGVGHKRARIVAVYGDPTFNRVTTGVRTERLYDHKLTPLQNHAAAVQVLVERMEAKSPGAWAGKWHAGGVGDGYMWVRDGGETYELPAALAE